MWLSAYIKTLETEGVINLTKFLDRFYRTGRLSTHNHETREKTDAKFYKLAGQRLIISHIESDDNYFEKEIIKNKVSEQLSEEQFGFRKVEGQGMQQEFWE